MNSMPYITTKPYITTNRLEEIISKSIFMSQILPIPHVCKDIIKSYLFYDKSQFLKLVENHYLISKVMRKIYRHEDYQIHYQNTVHIAISFDDVEEITINFFQLQSIICCKCGGYCFMLSFRTLGRMWCSCIFTINESEVIYSGTVPKIKNT
jgi:hypothetical protein